MKLAFIFTDHMMLQRHLPIRVFGEGDGHALVRFCGRQAEANSVDGQWLVTLPPMPEGGPHEMTVTLNGETMILRDILVGEIFLAGGQSNMEQPVFRTLGARQYIETCENDRIRLFKVPHIWKKGYPVSSWTMEHATNLDTPWSPACRQVVPHFSAIGYYFARELEKELDIPVGVIDCCEGGKVIETFIPYDEFHRHTCLKQPLAAYEAALAQVNLEENEAVFEKFAEESFAYFSACDPQMFDDPMGMGVRLVLARETMAFADNRYPNMPYYGPYSSSRPGCLWETMLMRIVPFAFRGVLWYQGESNGNDRNYKEKYKILMDCWRQAFQNPEMPFYACELAPHGNTTEDNSGWPFLREQQLQATREYTNNYLATTQELGDEFDIHPLEKDSLAHRLVLLALKHTYGRESITADGPIYRSMEVEGGNIRLRFDNVKSFIMRQWPREFYIAGEDRVFYPAWAGLQGDTLLVGSDKVQSPVAVRYCFHQYHKGGNIYNEAGIPLHPFRTDDWDDVTTGG